MSPIMSDWTLVIFCELNSVSLDSINYDFTYTSNIAGSDEDTELFIPFPTFSLSPACSYTPTITYDGGQPAWLEEQASSN